MRRSSWIFLIASVVAGVPLYAHAASIIQIVPSICNCTGAAGSGSSLPSAPDWGCVLQTFQDLMNDMVAVATILITLYLAWAGIGFISSPTNPENRTKARTRIVNAVIGLAIVLGAWLLIDSLMKVVYNSGVSQGTVQFGPWNQLLQGTGSDDCIVVRQNIPGLPDLQGTNNPNGSTAGPAGSAAAPVQTTSGSPATGAKCSVATSGTPCDPANFSGFSNPNNASEICNAESAGGRQLLSKGDTVTNPNGGKSSYSVGLFQINLTNSYPITVDGQNCSAAFSGPCQSSNGYHSVSKSGACTSTIINQGLYNDCVKSAVTSQNSIQAAQLDSKNGTTFKRWSTSSLCGIN